MQQQKHLGSGVRPVRRKQGIITSMLTLMISSARNVKHHVENGELKNETDDVPRSTMPGYIRRYQ